MGRFRQSGETVPVSLRGLILPAGDAVAAGVSDSEAPGSVRKSTGEEKNWKSKDPVLLSRGTLGGLERGNTPWVRLEKNQVGARRVRSADTKDPYMLMWYVPGDEK
jgi:hypothetical protein